MILSGIDIGIIFLYLIAVSAIGVVLQRRAKGNKGDYLLGGIRYHGTPWVSQTLPECLTFPELCGW